MCLSSLDAETKQVTYGYKVFESIEGDLFSVCQGSSCPFRGGAPLPQGVWLHQSAFRHPNEVHVRGLVAGTKLGYDLGWHVYVDWPFWLLQSERIRRVEVASVTASGTQGEEPVVVADWIKILASVTPPQKEAA